MRPPTTPSARAWSSARTSPTAAVALGAAGAWLVALTASGLLAGRPVRWWFTVRMPGGSLWLILGLAALCAGWLWLGALRAGPRWLGTAAVLWGLPLCLGPAVFSRDVYSYLAQGLIVHRGLNPYAHGPAVLGHGPLLHAVSPFWRTTPAPYGPAFLGVAALAAAAAGPHLVLGTSLMRIPEVAGLTLLWVFLPRLAARAGGDPDRARWLVVLSPLALVELLGAAHNDALMAGLLVAGVALAVEGRPAAGVALCALATTVKLPALLGVAFVAVAWARAQPGSGARARTLLRAGAIGVLVAAGVSLLSGLGVRWLSGAFLSSPAKVRLAVTPATELGWIAHALGAPGSARAAEGAAAGVTLVLGGLFVAWLLWGARWEGLVPRLGIALVGLVLAGPALWPWYGIWGLALLAAHGPAQRTWWLAAALGLPVFLIDAGGRLILPIGAAPWVLLAYALLLAAAAAAAALRGRPGAVPSRPLAGA